MDSNNLQSDFRRKNIVECLKYIKLQCAGDDMFDVDIIISDAIRKVHLLSNWKDGEVAESKKRNVVDGSKVAVSKERKSKEWELDAVTLQAFYFFMRFTRSSEAEQKDFVKLFSENEVGKKDKVLN